MTHITIEFVTDCWFLVACYPGLYYDRIYAVKLSNLSSDSIAAALADVRRRFVQFGAWQ